MREGRPVELPFVSNNIYSWNKFHSFYYLLICTLLIYFLLTAQIMYWRHQCPSRNINGLCTAPIVQDFVQYPARSSLYFIVLRSWLQTLSKQKYKWGSSKFDLFQAVTSLFSCISTFASTLTYGIFVVDPTQKSLHLQLFTLDFKGVRFSVKSLLSDLLRYYHTAYQGKMFGTELQKSLSTLEELFSFYANQMDLKI